MKITNAAKLPPLLVKFLSQEFYDYEAAKGTYSITTLIKPIQASVLAKRYDDKITVEAASRGFSILGSGVHAVLEKMSDKDTVLPERLKVRFGQDIVSGKWDLIIKKKISDFKVTSTYSYIYGSHLEDYKLQLSCYRYLFYICKKVMLDDIGSIIFIFRDWRKSEVRKVGYPKHFIQELNCKLYSIKETQAWISNRLKLIHTAESKRDNLLPMCSPEQRWFNARSFRNTRCIDWCDASPFCQQYKRLKKEEA